MEKNTAETSLAGLKNQKALVTGASSGIGEACALALAAAGAEVIINYRTHPEEAERVVRGLNNVATKARKGIGNYAR